MQSTHQVSLFGGGPPAFDARLRTLRRRQLDAGAWVDYLEGWLQGHDGVFAALASEAGWQQQHRRMYDRTVAVPRLLADCPAHGPSADLLRRMSLALSVHYGLALPAISLAWYRHGADSVAMHADRMGRLGMANLVAIVSLGAPRRFVLRARHGGAGIGFRLGWGDLLVMGGSCQRDWLHGVPKSSHAAARMSIIFRQREEGPGAARPSPDDTPVTPHGVWPDC